MYETVQNDIVRHRISQILVNGANRISHKNVDYEEP